MAFGVYVHIPYCLQRCVYCDFATYESSQILPPEEYINLVCEEIKLKAPHIKPRPVDTIYFGGGTPSLLEPELIRKVLLTLKDCGFTPKEHCEITLEVNPATVNTKKITAFLVMGVNRFSLGAQTFRDDLLKIANRKHSARDTINTLALFKDLVSNYSVDLLFALPLQTMDDLKKDLDIIIRYAPKHVSPYCLTVVESNPMAKNRPMEADQIRMFSLIEETLTQSGFNKYEISNFSLPAYESRHNLLYWNDQEYWGVGLSSHSYIKWGSWGTRFWNPRSIEEYAKFKKLNWQTLGYHEVLSKQEALTDYFHTQLRKTSGLNKHAFVNKFLNPPQKYAAKELATLKSQGLLREDPERLFLSQKGVLVSNQVFKELTFLPN
ncbi:MAG: radical SAM family heme chaperone HemW [Oligoflexia bacterium]|nr:radical SAM family heme chaperone HemW [Oligoflexia bacterium]